MTNKSHHEKHPGSVESISRRVEAIYNSLHLINFSVKPPLYTPAQINTPDIVYHELLHGTSLHIGKANAKNVPSNVLAWRKDAEIKFVLWHNLRQRSGVISTPYYLAGYGKNNDSPFVLMPRNKTRVRDITPAPGEDNSRWLKFVKIINDAQELGLAKQQELLTSEKSTWEPPEQSTTKLSA